MAYKYYKQKEKDSNYLIINKVAILPIDMLNSNPPAMKNQQLHNQVF